MKYHHFIYFKFTDVILVSSLS